MQEVASTVHLLAVQMHAPFKMAASGRFLLGYDLRVALGLVQVLDVAERRAHWAPDEQSRLLLIKELLRLGSHLRVVEVPLITFVIDRRYVKRYSRDAA